MNNKNKIQLKLTKNERLFLCSINYNYRKLFTESTGFSFTGVYEPIFLTIKELKVLENFFTSFIVMFPEHETMSKKIIDRILLLIYS